MQRPLPRVCLACWLFFGVSAQAVLDKNGNGISDVWEQLYSAQGLNPNLDSDGDGFTNLQEAIAGTNPFDAKSHPAIGIGQSGIQLQSTWTGVIGKHYQILGNATLDPAGWQVVASVDGTGAQLSMPINTSQPYHFFKLVVSDLNTAGDGLTDWEKRMLGLDPTTQHTGRYDQTDYQRINAAWNLTSTITAGVVDGDISKGWPDKGVIAIRRSVGAKPVTVNFTLGGTATLNADYTSNATTSITVPAGATETWVQFTPIPNSVANAGTKTITLTLVSGTGYTVASPSTGTVNITDEPTNALPNAKAAARFLVQAAFGPDQDTSGDTDQIPQNVQQVMALGYSGWIDAEFAKPATYLQPFVDASSGISQFYSDSKTSAWWGRVMGTPETPGGPAVQNDALRHRIAFCLSQILVASDNPETLAVQYSGVANYYDLFVKHAFGNYRNLLYDVTRHPVMGFFLSSLRNQKANPAANIYPDENYAREVMQLFSIGLWKLNPDGTHVKDIHGNDIPTYDNTTITNFARVFTGMSFGGTGGTSFLYAQDDWGHPMALWDAYHDLTPKTLLDGATLPLRTVSSPDTGAATDLDLNGALDIIFNHPNVGPFVGRLLIQRLVTSNPSAAYVGRVATAFANNGSGVRGDMKAVIKAILLDDEARNPANMSDPNFGKLREPFLRTVNFGRAFNAAAQVGFYALGNFYMDHYEEPMKSPSVFNFYLPTYTPPGTVQTAGLVSPEYQIVNATSAITAPNYFYNAITEGLDRYGNADPTRVVNINTTQELALASTNNTDDLDRLIRRLDLALTYGTLTPQQFQIVREAVLRIDTSTYQWQQERLKLAIYLIVTSPEFCVAR